MGKILIIECSDSEYNIFQETVQWLSEKLSSKPYIVNEPPSSLIIDPFKRTVKNIMGEIPYLTAKEFDLLNFLYQHRGQVFTKEQLYEKVWENEDILNASNLTSFIRKVRKKIEPVLDKPQYIITVWGASYKFSEEKP